MKTAGNTASAIDAAPDPGLGPSSRFRCAGMSLAGFFPVGGDLYGRTWPGLRFSAEPAAEETII